MKAIQLKNHHYQIVKALAQLSVIDAPIPVPGDEEVLIRMERASCNPSDLAYLRGEYKIRKTLPTIPGFEGCGIVEKTGQHLEAQSLAGKRVSCFIVGNEGGTWAEYTATNFRNCIPMSDDIPVAQAATFFVNPFTSYALMQLVEQKHTGAFMQNGASGQIGQMMTRLARKLGKQVIHIVRKDSHVEQLRNQNEHFVFNQKEENFDLKLKEAAHQLNATIAFDSVGGELTGTMLNAMPHEGEIHVVGGLSGQPIGNIQFLPIIFEKKTLQGFNLYDWMEKMTREEMLAHATILESYIRSGVIRTEVQMEIPLDDIKDGIINYIKNMSAGKILLTL